MADVIVYIDGFNLYYGALKRTPYKWLDLGRLCSTMLPNDNVLAINYYTARISARPGNPGAPTDQQMYLRALRTIPNLSITYGHFLTHPVRRFSHRAPRQALRQLLSTDYDADDKSAPESNHLHLVDRTYFITENTRPSRSGPTSVSPPSSSHLTST